MKRRVKFALTLVSMCLVIAVMAFGVFAATSQQMKVTNNITFTAGGVFVDVAASAAHGSDEMAEYSFTAASGETGEAAMSDWTPKADIVLTETDSVLTYTFTFTNRGDKTAAVVFTESAAKPAGLTIAYAAESGETPVDQETTSDGAVKFLLQKGAAITVTKTVSIADFSKDIASFRADFTVAITPAA